LRCNFCCAGLSVAVVVPVVVVVFTLGVVAVEAVDVVFV
jgi:hypothetical protein